MDSKQITNTNNMNLKQRWNLQKYTPTTRIFIP